MNANSWRYSGKSNKDGFMNFLTDEQAAGSDEFRDSDPFDIEENIGSVFHRARIECTIELARTALKGIKEPKILDIGCGQGHITLEIKKAFPGAEITGIDHSVSALKDAVKNCSGCSFAAADAYDLPIKDGYFDLAVCNNVWEHVHAPTLLLAEAGRTLKKDGYFILSTPNRFRFPNILRIIRGKHIGRIPKYHITEYTYGQVKEQLAFCGFGIIRSVHKKTELRKLSHRTLNSLISFYLKITGSDFHTDSTSFFLAEKKEKND